MTDGKTPDYSESLPRAAPRRRWWEKQRFMIPIAVAVLAPAVFLVAGLVARDGRTPQQMDLSTGQTRAAAPTAEPAPRDTPEAGTRAAAESSADTAADTGRDASDSETDVTVLSSAERAQSDEAESPAVCQRILALREQFEMQGVNPLEVYLDMLDIQKDAKGTAVAADVDRAVRTMEDFVSGNADTGDVVAAGGALVAAC